MGKLEQLHKTFNGILSEDEVKTRLEQIKRDIREDWEVFKEYHRTMHGIHYEDNPWDMFLVSAIKRKWIA